MRYFQCFYNGALWAHGHTSLVMTNPEVLLGHVPLGQLSSFMDPESFYGAVLLPLVIYCTFLRLFFILLHYYYSIFTHHKCISCHRRPLNFLKLGLYIHIFLRKHNTKLSEVSSNVSSSCDHLSYLPNCPDLPVELGESKMVQEMGCSLGG